MNRLRRRLLALPLVVKILLTPLLVVVAAPFLVASAIYIGFWDAQYGVLSLGKRED